MYSYIKFFNDADDVKSHLHKYFFWGGGERWQKVVVKN